MNALLRSVLPTLLCAGSLATQVDPGLLRAAVRRHADHCHRLHRDVVVRTEALQQAVSALLARPDAKTLLAARAAWVDARAVYGELEVLRFHGGPMDEVEPLLNAWPVDEFYIEQVAGGAGAGIVNDRRLFPLLNGPVLAHANERGSEANVSVGWHAIEFLLWGQDLDAAGPGNRAHTDFVDGVGAAADRRRAYLAIVTELLVGHLRQLERQWAPGADNFRRRYEADPADAARRMLTGAMILTGFELAGERLAVAYETRDQEQEHSCFSDTTCTDLMANQAGIVATLQGGGGERAGADLLAVIRAKDGAIAAHLEQCLAATSKAMRAIPPPFDQAFLGEDDAPGRVAIRAAMQALEQQAEAIAIAGRLLGFDLPVRPGN